MTLSTAQKTIEQLLTGNRQYQIPDFQRPYVWEEPQAIALVNDLLDAWRMNDGDYFLGSIVLVDHPGGDNVDIIDGQQRLTTLCIIVALLRHLAGTDAGLHDEIGQLLSIPESRIKGLDERPRLSVRECDRTFFDTFIVGDNIDSLLDVDANSLTPPSVRRIHDNARAMLDSLSDPEILPPEDIQNFVQYLMLQVSLIEVTTDSYQAAHRIFSVLNTRGVPLAATDIFKAQVLSHVAPANRPRYAALWEEAINSLATDNPDAFFGHLLTLMLRSPAKRALIDCFTEQVLTPFFATKSGEQFIDEVLVPSARAYALATLAPLAGHPAATPSSCCACTTRRTGSPRPCTSWALIEARTTCARFSRPSNASTERRSQHVSSPARVPSSSRSSSAQSTTDNPSTLHATSPTIYATGPPQRLLAHSPSPPFARSSSTMRWSPNSTRSLRGCREASGYCQVCPRSRSAAFMGTSTLRHGTNASADSF